MLKTLCGPLGPGPIAEGFDGLSPCFSSLVLDSIPIAVLLVHTWAQCQSIYRRRQTIPLEDRSVSFWIQMTSCLCMTTFPITILLVHVIKVDPEDVFSYIYPYELIAQLTQFAAWLCGAFIVSLSNAYGAPLNYGIRLWWIMNFIISCKDVQSQAFRLADGKDLRSLLIVNCGRLSVSAILAVDSIVSFGWIFRRIWSCLTRPHFRNLHGFHHPWLQTHQEVSPKNGALSDTQIWNTWLASEVQSSAVNNLDPKSNHIGALNLLSWFEGIDSDGEPYARFSVEVEPVGAGETAWVFSSSFSDWMWLGYAVKKACEAENQPINLPEFPNSIKHCSVGEIASILQLYLHRATEHPSIQTPLADFLGSQTKLLRSEREILSEPITSNSVGIMNHLDETRNTEGSPKLVESKSVKQMINEVITTPIAAILERKIRPPSEEVLFFQTKDHEKIISATVFQYNTDTQPIVYDIHVSAGISGWCVRRRFNQFLELHYKMQQLFDDRLLPAVPSKSLLNSSHSRFLENRRRQLDIFIQSLVNVNYFQCRPLYEFLNYDRLECPERSEPDSDYKIDNVHKFGIVISKWQFSDSSDYRFNPIYYFEVYEYFSLNQYLKWTIRSTLSDLKDLHTSLRRRFPNDVLPDLPKWSSIHSSGDPAFAEALALQFELFLQKVINCTPLSCPEINAFLELDNGHRHISTGMHSVAFARVSLSRV